MLHRAALTLLLAVLPASVVLAQEAYPSRPVTMIVPFPPGGIADLTGRPFAASMERYLKQKIVIENKPGAGGGIGMAAAAKAKPDGYTVLMALSSISIIPEADRLSSKTPMYETGQFRPVALVSADPTVLVVRAESPWRSAKEFVEDARKRPGAITYASSGVYGTLHVAMETLGVAADVKLHHIPYTGGGPAVTALLGGHVDALASGPAAVIQHIKAGKLRPLATWGATRLEALPEVPTLKELGFDAEFYIWSGLFVPAGVPEPIVTTLRTAARQAAADPEFRRNMAAMDTPIQYLDAPEFQTFWDKDAKRLGEVVRRIGPVVAK